MVDADASVYLRPPLAAASTSQRNTAPHPFAAPHEQNRPVSPASRHWFGCPLFGGRPSCRPRRYRTPSGTCWRTSRRSHRGIRRPCRCRSSVVALWAALRAGGRLCTWTHPRPLSAPFPPTAPTSGAYPLSPDFLPCGAVAPRAGMGVLCRG